MLKNKLGFQILIPYEFSFFKIINYFLSIISDLCTIWEALLMFSIKSTWEFEWYLNLGQMMRIRVRVKNYIDIRSSLT